MKTFPEKWRIDMTHINKQTFISTFNFWGREMSVAIRHFTEEQLMWKPQIEIFKIWFSDEFSTLN